MSDFGEERKKYFKRLNKDKDAIPFPSSKANGRDAAR